MNKFDYKNIFKNKHVAVSRAISMVENNDPNIVHFYNEVYKKSNSALRIGITGPPGAGKSTLVDQLISCFLSEKNLLEWLLLIQVVHLVAEHF